METDTLEVKGLSMSYIFTFDLGSQDNINLSKDESLTTFSTFVAGSYLVGKREIRTYQATPVEYLNAYHSEMYERRFKPPVLTDRNTLLIQLPSLELHGLSHMQCDLVTAAHAVKLDCTISLNEMGIGSIVFWLHLDPALKFGFEQLQKFSDVDNLTSSVDWRLGPQRKLRINGSFAFLDLVRFVIITIYATIFPKVSLKKLKKRIDLNESLQEIHSDLCKKFSDQLKVSADIQRYPIFHIDFSQVPNADNKSLDQFVVNHKGRLRGLVTRDVNWDKKKKDVVEQLFKEHNFSTRESIYWFTHPNGSMKLYSSQLETDILTSKVLITFELEIMLTMKHFIYKIIQNLNYFSNLSRKVYPLRSIAKLRDREMRRLDEYYNLDFLQKDTTISRLDRFKKMFKIEEILQIAVKKFEGLNVYMTTEFQNASSKRQLALSIIFGVFGAGNLVFSVLRKAVEDKILVLSFQNQILITVGAMMFVFVCIFIIWGRIRMR